MSALNPDEPAQTPPASIDTQQLQQQIQQQQQQQQQQVQHGDLLVNHAPPPPPGDSARKRPSFVTSCIKRGLAQTCAYPDPDAEHHAPPGLPHGHLHDFALTSPSPGTAPPQLAAPPVYATLPGTTIAHQAYYDYNGAYTGASTSTFRPNKRPRGLTEEETAAITRNFSRGDFYIGNNAPVRIDTRLPVRLTLGEGDQVHFTIGETL
ncbi:hypothetical protein DXG01_016005 [Tephrocybe rancida]|nr:hypothetical protein DXG01_016005 [Tephrocybe rancida]